MKENMQTVWVGELERLGYHMIVVGRTEKEAREALLEAYDKTYRDLHDDEDPRKVFLTEGKSFYDCAAEGMYVRELAFGRVEWV